MSHPAPWSIKGVDKETREKMKQMAQSQGMTLADFLDTLMHESTSHTKDSLDDATKTSNLMVSENDKNQETLTLNQNNATLKTKDNTINTTETRPLMTSRADNIISKTAKEMPETAVTKHSTVTHTTQPSISDTKIDTHKNAVMPLRASPPKTQKKEIEKPVAKNPSRTKAKQPSLTKSVKSKHDKNTSMDTMQSKTDLFHKLTQKIGIETPVITQLSENNITDTIIRERQLRDFMRVQMTEMRDLIGVMFESQIDKKIHELIHVIASGMDNHDGQSLSFLLDSQNVLKKEDLDAQFNLFSDMIENSLLERIKQEFQSEFELITHNIDKHMSDIIEKTMDNQHNHANDLSIDHMEAFEANLLQKIKQEFQSEFKIITHNIDKQMSDIIEKTINSQYHEIRDLSAGDIATVSAFQDTAKILSSRMGRIEDVCVMLDNKLSQIQTHHHTNQHNNNEVQSIKDDLERYMQLIPDYMNKIVTRNSNSADIKVIMNTLNAVSKRLSHLETSVQNVSSTSTNNHSEPHHQSHEEEEEDDYNDNALEVVTKTPRQHNHDDDDWGDTQDDTYDFNDAEKRHFLDKVNYGTNDDNMNDIRKFDRNAILKGVKNSQERANDTDNINSKKSFFNLNKSKQILIVSGVTVVIAMIIGFSLF